MLLELRRTKLSQDSLFLAECFCTLNTVRLPNADEDNSLIFPRVLTGGLKAVGFLFFSLVFYFSFLK